MRVQNYIFFTLQTSGKVADQGNLGQDGQDCQGGQDVYLRYVPAFFQFTQQALLKPYLTITITP
jgi:hypothetical protein